MEQPPKPATAHAHPPPKRQAKRQLSLNAAITAATRREGATVRSFEESGREFPSTRSQSSRQQEMEAYLLELQAEIIVREDQLAQREKRLEARELGLNEREALLEAHRKLLETQKPTSDQEAKDLAKMQTKEARALEALRLQLEAQEAKLLEAKQQLQKRENFIQACEDELVEKSMILTEREARVEQKEEDGEGSRTPNE